ncbi:hypothetical protein DRJ22_00025 [Candidatus Woesearchaeota archaeon]|nr:MAG: hypothetical protein B6U93_01390 [Candidatus Woesearchaeota archaeon ex4484_78]RLE47098.1 MAG: hypothetical protein DRJ22_00025 [Candidatus Woesearchaeota archaeon]
MIIIEHLDTEIYEWSKEEYKHIVDVLGKENVLFTNIKDKSKLPFANCESKSIKELNLKKPCILDPEAKKTLEPEDNKKYENFIFGGILGNDPPQKRTQTKLTKKLKYETRNLGKKQMSTDTAAITTWKILNGTRFKDLKFIDDPEIQIEKGMSCIMPYRYLTKNNSPDIPEKIMKLIKKEELI